MRAFVVLLLSRYERWEMVEQQVDYYTLGEQYIRLSLSTGEVK